MFSFHKPRVYRSTEGCCICRAKSSSSRFTDSRKYEDDSMKCFNLSKPRKGEICNACVLLVKRFKRLPSGSNRHWGHVVDARVGPGSKSMTKFKRHKEDVSMCDSDMTSTKGQNGKISLISEKFSKIFKKSSKSKSTGTEKDKSLKNKRGRTTSISWEEQSLPLTPESLNSDCEDHSQYSSRKRKIRRKINRRKLQKPKRNCNPTVKVNFFDENEWKPLKSCCGMVYENQEINALIIDSENYKPCAEHSFETTSNNSSNKIMTDNFIQQKDQDQQQSSGFPAMKKHHLFLKRQKAVTVENNFPYTENALKTDTVTNSNAGIKMITHSMTDNKVNIVNVKQNDNKALIKISDQSKFCVELKSLKQENFYNKHVDPSNTKFSENSSDSGFDENMLERKSSSPLREEDKKILVQPMQTMFLASGVKIRGQQQNLILAGNTLASKTIQQRRQSQMYAATKFAQNNNCQNDQSAIYNQQTTKGGLITLPINGVESTIVNNNNMMTNQNSSLTNLNQKIILVKAKYNNQSTTIN